MICFMKSDLKIVWKTKIIFLLSKKMLFFIGQKYILLSETYFFKIPKNLITSAFFFAEADTKKHRYASAKASNAALVKLTDWIIKNDHVINWATLFVSDLNMIKQAMLFDSPQHSFFGWRLQMKSLY